MNTHLSEALDGVEIMKGAAQEGTETETFITNARRVRDVFVRQGDIERAACSGSGWHSPAMIRRLSSASASSLRAAW
jgi:hypothetical protein